MADFFAVAAPGVRPFLAYELRRLELLEAMPKDAPQPAASPSPAPHRAAEPAPDSEAGGVNFSGDASALYRANLHLRTASRVLVRLGEFDALSFPELRKKAARLAWENYLAPGQAVDLRVTCHKSRLYHSDAVAERILDSIAERLGKPPAQLKTQEEEDRPAAQLIVVRLQNDHASVSIDSSGALLHRRGYRLATAKAPLRETLAAALLLAAGWDGRSPLLDPMCGSGTIAIEAALLAAGISPGIHRRFAFMDWPNFDARLWQKLLSEAAQPPPGDLPPIQASDRDAGAIVLAQANAERAGAAGMIEFSQRAISAIQPPPGPGWVVTNPPYGLRVGASKDLRNLYAQLGNVLRLHCPGWRVAILSSDLRLLGQMRMKLDTSLGLVNGGVSVRVGRGKVADVLQYRAD